MADAGTTAAKCTKCTKSELDPGVNLKHCAKCHTTPYCSRECQKADWKGHKKICASNAASTTLGAGGSRPKGLTVNIDNPFHRLHAKTRMHDRPEQDVFKLLIDTYRFRVEDNYNLEGDAAEDSIHGGAADGRHGLRQFLRLAESRHGLLPAWWSEEKAVQCEALGLEDGWSSLAKALVKSDIIKHYANPVMPMQLRLFGEQVYGRGPGGQAGATVIQMQMMAERGEGHSSVIGLH